MKQKNKSVILAKNSMRKNVITLDNENNESEILRQIKSMNINNESTNTLNSLVNITSQNVARLNNEATLPKMTTFKTFSENDNNRLFRRKDLQNTWLTVKQQK